MGGKPVGVCSFRPLQRSVIANCTTDILPRYCRRIWPLCFRRSVLHSTVVVVSFSLRLESFFSQTYPGLSSRTIPQHQNPPTMSTIHTEKIDHAVSRLEEAGLSSGDDAAAATITTASSSGSKSHLPAIIGGVVGGVIFVAVILFLVICLRRRRKNRAYNAVHRGVDMPKAPGGPGMSGGLMPVSHQHLLLPSRHPVLTPSTALDVQQRPLNLPHPTLRPPRQQLRHRETAPLLLLRPGQRPRILLLSTQRRNHRTSHRCFWRTRPQSQPQPRSWP